MSVLALVRHGQASFLDEDYDRLSPLGITQARLLGQDWIRRGEAFDEVYVGPRRRQQETVATVGAEFRARGLPWPEPVIMPELDEYDLSGLLDHLAPALAGRDSEFEALVAAYRQAADNHAARFQRMFEALLIHWQSRADELETVETWPVFRDRVRHWLNWVTQRPGRGRRVAAFTSGGVIGAAVALVLDAPDRSALELNWRLRNGSVTQLIFTRGRLTLDEYNSVAHLRDPKLRTYR
jgi:broad specificity phosphatase PhoE